VVEVVAYWRRHRPWPGAASGEPSDVVIAGRIVDWTVAHVRARGEPMEGVDRAVALLRGLGLGVAIASSSSHRLIDAVCDRLGLEWIEIRCSADDELRGKLAGDVYLTAARAAGMRCIAVPDRFLTEDPRYREAQLILGSLDELDESRLRSVGWRRDS
jgi:beta-phosphoglucomutase-like phosphatase (HAD superfamily)